MQELSDDIIIRAREGDIGSFEIIYKATAGFVYNVAYRIVHNAQDAEEVTQEVFLNVHQKLKNFRLESSLKTWIYRITVNCAINYSKRETRVREKKTEYYGNLNPWQLLSDSASENHRHKEITELFLKILNPDQRICVVLRSIEGLSYQQIADTLKISINTVRSRLKRAREKLLAMRREVISDEL